MTDETLRREWQARDNISDGAVRDAAARAIAQDRIARDRDWMSRLLSVACFVVLSPLLVWAAANAVTPLVRGGYALMALGIAVMLYGEFAYFSWNRKARPGPSNSLTQLATNIALLRQQAMLMRSGALWCAPVFVGAGMVGWWVYVERSQGTALVLWLALAITWVLAAIAGLRKLREVDDRRARLEAVLNDLQS